MPVDGRSSRLGSPLFFITLAIAAFAAGMGVRGALPLWIVVACVLPFIATIAMGVAFPISGVFARAVHRGARTKPLIALTFDDGPDAQWTPPLLDLLDRHGQKATFFVIGERAEGQRALLQDIVTRGHELANHTWSHSYGTPFMSPRTLAAELVRTNTIIEQATGWRPRWFRPPVGLLSPRVVAGAELASMELVCWSRTARDGVERTSADDAFNRLMIDLTPGAILVLHDARLQGHTPPVALEVVSRLLHRMEEQGLRSVTLSELCGPQ